MMTRQRVAIIGAGTAGLATAIVLARQGHDVTIFEQAMQMAPVGAGLLLQPSGMAVLAHLGVLNHASDLGAPIDALQGWTPQGLLINSRYAEAAPNAIGLGMHRAALCDVLMQQLQAYDVQWYMGATVHRVADYQDHSQLDVTVINPQSYRPATAISLRYDMVLVANGARSRLRPAAWTRLDRPYPWGAVWAIVPETTALNYRILHQYYHGATKMMGLLPTGCMPQAQGTRLTSIFWSLPADQIDQWINTPAHFDAWKQDIRQHWPAAADWVDQSIASTAQFLPARYRDVVMSCFGHNRLGVIGDAAHAMSPQLGQGTNMALLDAWAIGQAFAQTSNYQTLWRHYHHLRQPSTHFYQSMSRLLTPFYQSHRTSYGVLRDTAFTWMYRVPWLRKQMATTISGIKTGALSQMDLRQLMTVPDTNPS